MLLFRSGWRINALIGRLTELAREFVVDFAGIAARPRRDLRGEQTGNESILVGRPNGAIQTSKGGPGALFATEAKRTVEQAINKPLEANRHLVELPAQLRGDAINHLAAHRSEEHTSEL